MQCLFESRYLNINKFLWDHIQFPIFSVIKLLQKEDWPQHKKLCKVLQTARGKSDHWTCQTSGEKLLAMVEAGLGRKPTQFEHDIALHPR